MKLVDIVVGFWSTKQEPITCDSCAQYVSARNILPFSGYAGRGDAKPMYPKSDRIPGIHCPQEHAPSRERTEWKCGFANRRPPQSELRRTCAASATEGRMLRIRDCRIPIHGYWVHGCWAHAVLDRAPRTIPSTPHPKVSVRDVATLYCRRVQLERKKDRPMQYIPVLR